MTPAPTPTLEPVVLEGRLVRLEPMSLEHLDGLAEIAFDDSIWRWTIVRIGDQSDLEGWVRAALAARDAGAELPWVTVERASGRPIGSSRFLNVVLDHRRLEIGWTWVAAPWRRRGVNQEAKLLMLGHAFERLGCRRVEFKTDARNEPSRAALAGIGAVFEGVLRRHMVMADGSARDSAYFSILDREWPAVRAGLEASVARHAAASQARGGQALVRGPLATQDQAAGTRRPPAA